ncbi:MAG: hypothetical protein FWD69_18435 [Polyangiaceae bacterium]|nr:hypothetical protein [Polyangiaceae bacterium]
MNPKEQEIAIGQLEERVERVRILYEQYFLGFEKLEPTVPRKDVDRRFAVLKKLQIRNTALRFRLNVVTQRYNTFSMYWLRICRQIEEGTYKRHLRRAQRRFGDNASLNGALDMSVDVDLTELDADEDVDIHAILAEADAAAAAFERGPVDTARPSASSGTPILVAPTPEASLTKPAPAKPSSEPRESPIVRATTAPVRPPQMRRRAPIPLPSKFVSSTKD